MNQSWKRNVGRHQNDFDELLNQIHDLEEKLPNAKTFNEHARLIRELAKRMRQRDFSAYINDDFDVILCWEVDKVFTKQHTSDALDWMKRRGLDWDGKAPALRHELKRALERNETIPSHHFGLYVGPSVVVRCFRGIPFHEARLGDSQ